MRQGGQCWKRLLDQEDVESGKPVISSDGLGQVSVWLKGRRFIQGVFEGSDGDLVGRGQHAVKFCGGWYGGGRCNGGVFIDVVDEHLVGTASVVSGLRLIRTAILGVAGLGYGLAAAEVDQGGYTGSSGCENGQGEEG